MHLLTKHLKFASYFKASMDIFDKQLDLTAHLQPFYQKNARIGFVPTMGALHQGHLSLLEQSVKENDLTVISIFVNPTQFNNAEDLAKYPRTLDSDVEKIKTVSNQIIVYAPSVDDIYNGNTVSVHFDYDGLENQMEGRFRPGHFNGVGTIVKRLFEIVKPANAYFGEKDFQQLQIVKKMVEKHQLPVHIIGCPIFREANGLAMSSRNERLTAAQREKAAIIFQTLQTAKTKFATESPQAVIDWVTQTFAAIPDFDLEYFEIADESTLEPAIEKIEGKNYRAFIAVFVNKIRLIDTISLN
jgi:pantoate--beta-alanine ligase